MEQAAILILLIILFCVVFAHRRESSRWYAKTVELQREANRYLHLSESGDLPDREYEVYEDSTGKFTGLRRPADGIHTYDGSYVPTRMLRTWFVGPDGLTEPQRKIQLLKSKLAESSEQKG